MLAEAASGFEVVMSTVCALVFVGRYGLFESEKLCKKFCIILLDTRFPGSYTECAQPVMRRWESFFFK